ncbi:MAG: hypothetical protein JO097_10245 [Acidobacteriaceae bacterium]|nr:hypothetical protein [Acidobacteriaceae bacterium]MBV9296585.1 hypothetical protein [Acidobacteriaceae bacterium]
MIPDLRARFNEQWSPELYAQFLEHINNVTHTQVGFRCSETPVFIPKLLLDKMVRYGRELFQQLVSNPDYPTASDGAIPPHFKVPNEPDHPLFVQADFGLVRAEDGSLEPKLVEIQGFPSLYGFQPVLAKEYQRVYRLNETLDERLTTFLDELDEESYLELLRRAILQGHDPQEVVLLEIDPYEQKTLADFLATQKALGIRIASVSEVQKKGRKLYLDGIEIKRIYNRVIVDELVRKSVQTAFQFTEDLDVEWAGHPNWFFRLSKFSLPWFRHVSVPETRFLSEVTQLPDNLDQYVLKPLYSFAGLGVTIGPSKEDIAAIPETQRGNFILQQRMDFVPTVDTPGGMTKVEIRIMYIWEDELKPVTTIIRTGRGKMMGVDFNKDLDWVGASAGFYIR